jgi:hypothetical protein
MAALFFNLSTFSFEIGASVDCTEPIVVLPNDLGKIPHGHMADLDGADNDDWLAADGDFHWVDGLKGFVKKFFVSPVEECHDVSP